MGTDKTIFAEVLWGATGSDVTRSSVSHVTGSDVNYVFGSMCICNRKLRNIRPSGAFWPEVTQSRNRKRPCPEVCSAHAPIFPVFFFLVVITWIPDVSSYSGEFLTKTTAAPSQEVVEGRSWYFLKRIRSWELNQTGFWIY